MIPPTPPTPPRPGGMPLTPPTAPVDQDDYTAQKGEQQNDEEKTGKGKRTFGGWFKGVLNGVTEGINKTFETVGDDEEI